MFQLAIIGSRGRMGSRICALAADDSRFRVVLEVDRDDAHDTEFPSDATPHAVIDFSIDEGTHYAIELALRAEAALLVGTTAYSDETRRRLEQAAESVPVLVAPNTSTGVAVLNHVVAQTAVLLGDTFDIDITETHHAGKRDAPSGTALRLVETLSIVAGRTVKPKDVHSRREGDIIGEHTVRFTGPGEQLALSHSATSRDVFALGALRAAAWLIEQPPGRYTINDMLGLGRLST